MTIEDEQLYAAVQWQRKQRRRRAVRLGDVTKELMDNRISPQQARFGPIAELWNRLLPQELRRHCKIVDISGGRLKVLVDLPAYMYEMQLCSSELLSEIQRQCPRARIKKIKFVVGSKARA
jgi:predicted nucleic acid-binding Zn ribbon protein